MCGLLNDNLLLLIQGHHFLQNDSKYQAVYQPIFMLRKSVSVEHHFVERIGAYCQRKHL